jgi:hypothetical protein
VNYPIKNIDCLHSLKTSEPVVILLHTHRTGVFVVIFSYTKINAVYYIFSFLFAWWLTFISWSQIDILCITVGSNGLVIYIRFTPEMKVSGPRPPPSITQVNHALQSMSKFLSDKKT